MDYKYKMIKKHNDKNVYVTYYTYIFYFYIYLYKINF